MRLAPTISALGLALAIVAIAAPAAAQHHMPTGKVDYEPPDGGDPEPPEGCVGAPNKVQITGSAQSFSPSTITIDPGQAVCFTWSTGSISHNVRANDGSFGSGEPTANGTFQRTFNAPGTYGYHCQVHGSASAGMRGTIVVRDNGGGEPGEETGPGAFSIDPGAYEVDENGGSVALTVLRNGGSEGKVTITVTTIGGSARKGKDFTNRKVKLTFNNGDRGPKTVTVPIKNDKLTENDETFSVVLTKPTGRATIDNSSATVTIHDDESAPAEAALLVPSGVEAAGVSGREIRLAWAEDGPLVEAVRIERRSGDGDFVEVAVVAAGSGEYVDADLPSGTSFHYRLRAEGETELSDYSEIVAAATDGAIGPCAAGALCLGGGRFEAKATFRPADGEPWRPALRSEVPAASRSGLFGLGSADDPQLMLKVVDGCAENDHFWVELAAVTDVELEVAVRDTRSGRTWAFYNPAGRAAGAVRDLDAFGTCP